uniref:(S)-2-hydroxy-acid oxidase n=1 Tax=Naja naja TaxID=35670 RepID=A0A8C6XSQ9_NAJNA
MLYLLYLFSLFLPTRFFSLCFEMALVCLSDFEAHAKKHLPKPIWEYFAAGADESSALSSSHRIYLRPRVLRDMSAIDPRTTILGSEIDFPVGIAPTGFHGLACPDGEQSTAQGINGTGLLSTYSTFSVEEIVAAAPTGLRWFQLYLHRKRTFSEQLVRRVNALGFQALVLTVDVPYTGKRRNDIRNNYQFLKSTQVKNFEGFPLSSLLQDEDQTEYGLPPGSIDPSINWNDITWLQSLTQLPIIIKGILTKEDAELAVRHGVQGIIVSNHGGRQLDGVLPTIAALVEVTTAVQGKIEVYLDGGIRTGNDVLKALALGAKCVFIGRPTVWGLAYKVNITPCIQVSMIKKIEDK